MASRSFAPRPVGVRDPRDPRKRNGVCWNWPRYQFFGGAQQRFSQAGTMPPRMRWAEGQNATGPISSRGAGGWV
jgi:hypothetical protein